MLVIVLLTYERLDFAKLTLESTAANLRCGDEPVWLHIADDGSSQEYRDELFALGHEWYGDNVSITNSARKGYGGNYNKATQVTHSIGDLFLPLEDDWELIRELDVTPVIKVLRDGVFRCVRMGYLGYTDELRGVLRWHQRQHWLELDGDSREKHVFAGGPRIETLEFERELGPWPEGVEQGGTELMLLSREAARRGIAWPLDLIAPRGDAFTHVGSRKAEAPEEEEVPA